MNVIDTPKRPPFLMEPFLDYRPVVLEGRVIPRLTGHQVTESETEIILDGRFGATFPNDLAYQAAWLIANALAIGQGFAYLSSETVDRPFAPIARFIDG